MLFPSRCKALQRKTPDLTHRDGEDEGKRIFKKKKKRNKKDYKYVSKLAK